MKNILIDVRYLENNKTGIAVGLEAFLSELEKVNMGCNIYLLFNNKKSNFKFKHIKINSNLFSIREHIELYKIFKRYNIDIFYSHHFISPLLKGRVKVINVIHDLIPLHINVLSKVGKMYYYLMNYITMQRSEIILANSYATKYDIEKFYKKKDVKVIYHSFNEKKLNKFDDNIFNKLNLERANYFLFVSSLKKHKNYENVIKAFERYNKHNKNSKLVLVGKKDKIFDITSNNNVIFTDFISDKELNSLYKYSKGLLFVSLIEGFGVPILEAQYHECPVITSNISSMPEVAGKGALLVNPYDINEIYEAMKKLDNRQVINILKKEGLENIKRFSWNKYAVEVIKIFEELK